MFLCRGAVAHGCQAGGTPRDQQGSTGQQLRHQAHAWAHVAQIRTERHTGTRCQGGRHWECCLREGEEGRETKQVMAERSLASGVDLVATLPVLCFFKAMRYMHLQYL